MVTIPQNVPFSQPQAGNITAQLAIAQQRIKTLEQENRQLKQQIVWEDQLFSNPHLSPGHKVTLRQIVFTVRKSAASDGLTKIYIPAIAEKVGLSAKTVGKNLQYLADTGALLRETDTATDQNGQRITRVYIGLTDAVKRPDQITPATPRNHGGLRSFCKDCGSEKLAEQKTIICLDCGSVQNQTTRLINPTDEQVDPQNEATEDQEAAQPTDNLTDLKNKKEPTDNLTAGCEKPASPPVPCSTSISHWQMKQEQAREAINTSQEMQPEQTAERELHQATMLLLDIAGDGQEHIIMNTNPAIPKKYITVHRRLTHSDMQAHLQGSRTLGATLQHQDGTTRALCFDVDDVSSWIQLENAATQLTSSGYKPLLEPSPAGRGGHLWLIFTECVNAAAARSQVVTIAPALGDVKEHWPSRGNQKVRLPAGRYVTPTFAQWTHLVDGENRDISKTGAGANSILNTLLSNLTPAELIPDAAPVTEPAPTATAQPERSAPRPQRPTATTEPDEQHRRKYGDHAMWVQWPSEQYLIDRFNAAHTIPDLATFERNGLINAAQIGRPERTASVGVTPDGERFTDFGAGARQPDGTPDGGDPFEFYIRSRRLEKAEALRELGRDLNRQASRELLRAARAGELLAAWVMEIITPTGRAIYNQNAARHGHPSLEAHSGGLVGFSTSEQEQPQVQQVEPEAILMDAPRSTVPETGELWQPEQPAAGQVAQQDYEGDFPPPQRPCICCNVTAWQWTGDTYICASPTHPPE